MPTTRPRAAPSTRWCRRAASCARTAPAWSARSRRSGPAEMSARLEAARQTIRDHDVTYNVYGDPLGMDRPWQLDIVPLPVAPDAWARLRGRPGAAGAPARPDPRRPLRRAAPAARPAAAAGPRLRQPGLPAAVSRPARDRRPAPAPARRGPRPHARRHVCGCWPIAPRRRPAPATPSRTGSRCRAACRRPSATVACSGWRRSSAACARCSTRWRRGRPTRRASCCSPRAPSTRPTSSTPTWPAISASCSSRAAT